MKVIRRSLFRNLILRGIFLKNKIHKQKEPFQETHPSYIYLSDTIKPLSSFKIYLHFYRAEPAHDRDRGRPIP